MTETIYSQAQLLHMLDALLKENSTFNWDRFYADRSKAIPFFVDAPDENLVQYVEQGWLPPHGKVLELGCGPGRNAVYFAKLGYDVDAVDLSSEALQWGRERAANQNVSIHFIHSNLFELHLPQAAYDVIYDSGCFHHIAPHRRLDYIRLIRHALKPGGRFGLTCFVENGILGGANLSDWEVYRQRSLKGGLGYTPEKLQSIFSTVQLQPVELRKMKQIEPPSDCFGSSGLWAALFRLNSL